MAWEAVVLNDFPCLPKASCVIDALHGWEMAADDALHCLHHPLMAAFADMPNFLSPLRK